MYAWIRNVVTFSYVACVLFSSQALVADTVIFFDDFDGGQITMNGVVSNLSGITSTESVQNYAGIGSGNNQFAGNFLRNITGGIPTTGTAGAKTTFTFTNLPTHDSINLSFLLATIDSWDGVDGLNVATGDYFNVHVDGIEVFEATFAQASGTQNNAYQAPQGGQLSSGSDLFAIDFLNDGAYDMSKESALTGIAHTSTTLVIDIFADGPGWQGEQQFSSVGLDESWAIDNFQVSLNAVPEPTAGLFLLVSTIAIGLTRRRIH